MCPGELELLGGIPRMSTKDVFSPTLLLWLGLFLNIVRNRQVKRENQTVKTLQSSESEEVLVG